MVSAARPTVFQLPWSTNWPALHCPLLPPLPLRSLSVGGINCLQRLEERLHLPPQQGGGDEDVQLHQSEDTPGGWPAGLTELSLGFSSSLRFRPKQVMLGVMDVRAQRRRSCANLGLLVREMSFPPPFLAAMALYSCAFFMTRIQSLLGPIPYPPSQIAAALLAAPMCITGRVTSLSLRDRGGRDAADPAGRVVDDAVLAAALGAMQQVRGPMT